VGEHLKKRRLDLGLRQKDAAREIGADTQTYGYWERGRTEPELRFFPAIIRFLGYDPAPADSTVPLGERLRAARRREGFSQRELARRLGLDPTTVQAWEAGTVRRPWPRLRRLFEGYVTEAPD
jgi:transcriptional regulator with XRE-family HTH domain